MNIEPRRTRQEPDVLAPPEESALLGSLEESALLRPLEESALLRLLAMSSARYEELLTVPAEYALERLGAATASLLRWERDRGQLRSLVNVGKLGIDEAPFPTDEVLKLPRYGDAVDLTHGAGVAYEANDPNLSAAGADLLARHGHSAAVSIPVQVDGRIWGVLWATKQNGPLAPGALAAAAHTAQAISPMIALAERLHTMTRLAFEDPLTGLGNRRLLDDTLRDLLAPGGTGCTVVVCDVNGLKQVNDDHGHAAGDKVLVAVADALAATVQTVPGAIAVRLGGDEFALVLPGAARTPAIQVVEATNALLSPGGTRISCGIASAAAGTPVRDAMATADTAQYSAKRLGALLLVASSDVPAVRVPTPRRRSTDLRPVPTNAGRDVLAAVMHAVHTLAGSLHEAPRSVHGRLEWLGERLLEPFDLDHWSVSRVRLDEPPHRLLVNSMGMRVGRPLEHSAADLLTDHVFDLTDYPLSMQAIQQGGWFCVDVLDDSTDPCERAVLDLMGKRYVLAVGASEQGRGSLLEVYGRSDELDLGLLGSTLGLAASAVLRRVVSQVPSPSTMVTA